MIKILELEFLNKESLSVLYKIVSNDIKEVVSRNYDIICFFTPGGVKSLWENFPEYNQSTTRIAAFGVNTFKAVEDTGLILDIKAPLPQSPSMVSALDNFLKTNQKQVKQ